jgi:multicomponent Na+:H+ antiporter subunit E
MPWVLALLLVVVWLAVTGSWTLANLFLAVILATLALLIVRRSLGEPLQVRRPGKVLALFWLFAVEMAKSVVAVVKAVLRPRIDVKPGLIIYPVSLKSDFEITLLANMITLTPGTLTVDVTEDRSHLVIHALDASDPEATRRDIADGFERRIREAFA